MRRHRPLPSRSRLLEIIMPTTCTGRLRAAMLGVVVAAASLAATHAERSSLADSFSLATAAGDGLAFADLMGQGHGSRRDTRGAAGRSQHARIALKFVVNGETFYASSVPGRAGPGRGRAVHTRRVRGRGGRNEHARCTWEHGAAALVAGGPRLSAWSLEVPTHGRPCAARSGLVHHLAPTRVPARPPACLPTHPGTTFDFPVLERVRGSFSPSATITSEGATLPLTAAMWPTTYQSPNHDAIVTLIGG